MLFAATHPDQTEALVTINGYARLSRAPDYPWGIPLDAAESLIALIKDRWGTCDVLGISNPSVVEGSPAAEWWARAERAAGSPRRAELKQRLAFDVDVRDVLPTITVPTLVIHTKHNAFVRLGHAHYLTEHIAGGPVFRSYREEITRRFQSKPSMN
jgi:pimeloyl-ACP methyl ester carboxylesterase